MSEYGLGKMRMALSVIKRSAFPIAVIAIAIALFVWGLQVRSYSYELQAVTYTEASNEVVVRTFIPPESGNITAWVQPHQMNLVAAFDVSEKEYLAWGSKNKWPIKEVSRLEIANISNVADPNDSATIENGWLHEWKYDEDDQTSTFRIYAYDRNSGRAYFSQLGD